MEDIQIAMEALRVLGNSSEEEPARVVAAKYIQRHLQDAFDKRWPSHAPDKAPDDPAPEAAKPPDSGAMTSRDMR